MGQGVLRRGEGSLGRVPASMIPGAKPRSASGAPWGVPMLQLAEVRWEPPGAVVPMVAEWDFEKRSCFYWNESQDRRIWVRGGE
jgi:hypothetical protein